MGRGKGESKHSPRRINALERAINALELRKGGASYKNIAEKLGYRTASAAYRAIDRALKKTLQEPTEQVRRLELERLDRLYLSVWAKAKGGDLMAIERALQISARRSKLLGLDAPTKIAPTTPDGAEPYDPGIGESIMRRLVPELAAGGAKSAAE
jgi:hypothetical protein